MTKYEMPELEEAPDSIYVSEDIEWRFIYCDDGEAANSILEDIRRILCETFELSKKDEMVKAYLEDRLLCIIDIWEPIVVISYFISKLLDSFLESLWDDKRVLYVVYVSSEHVTKQIGELSFEASTGYLQKEPVFENFEDMLPKSIFRLLHNSEEVGRALIKYCHYDVDDVNPTIKAIEIIYSQRRKGFGSKFLKQIEKYFERCGFDLIRVENVHEYYFFKKNGYEFDMDEGYKYLE